MRRCRTIVLYTVLAGLLVGLLLYGVVIDPLYPPLRDALVHVGARGLSQWLHGSIEIGALRGSLLNTLTLHNVVLRDAQGAVLGQVEALRLSYNPLALFRQRLEVHTLEILQPRFTVEQEPDGLVNLSKLWGADSTAEASDGGGLPFDIHLETLRIRDGTLSLRVPALPGVQQVDNLQAHLSARIDADGFRAQIHQFTAHTAPAEVRLQALQGLVESHAGQVWIADVRLQTAATLVTAHGVLPGGEAPADVVLQMQPLALSDLGRLLQNDRLHEPVWLTLTAQGPAAAVQVQGQFRTPAAQAELRGQFDMAAPPFRYDTQLSVTHVDLAALVGQAALQSDLNFTLHLQGEGVTPETLHSALRLEVQPSRLGPLTLQPSIMQLAVRHQQLQVQRLDLQTSMARLLASGTLAFAGTSDLHYRLTGELAELRQFLGTPDLAGAF